MHWNHKADYQKVKNIRTHKTHKSMQVTCSNISHCTNVPISHGKKKKKENIGIVLTFDSKQTLERKHEENLKNLWPQEYLEVALMAQMTTRIWLMYMFPFENYMTGKERRVRFQPNAIYYNHRY